MTLRWRDSFPIKRFRGGSAPDSDTVPRPIIAGLAADGFDVSDFHPTAVATEDLRAANHVVLIGVALPTNMHAATQTCNDVTRKR
jgi:arsenate reductase (thioredoxin)